MKRKLAVALLPLALGGCLPLPITIASTAFSGISYLTTGKSTSDHVLSAAMEEDCALTRPVFGDPVCREVGPGGEGRTNAVTVAYYPGDRDDGMTQDELDSYRTRGALNLADAVEETRQVAIAPRFLAPPPRVSMAGVVVDKDQIVPAPKSRALPVAADSSWATLVPSRTIEVAPLAAPVPSVTAPSAAPSVTRSAAPSATPATAVAPRPVAKPAAPTGAKAGQLAAVPAAIAPAAIAPAAPKVSVTGGDADRWVVIGSFRDIDRAKVMASRFADREPAILAATVDGGRWHRVAIGPLTPSAARQVRDGLGQVDGRQPWVVKAAR
ncbi:hypothetical protein GCM10017083_21900 [Thalassobaculum fulvum]|uniref:SPOR domain-containing protein n=1 Tax=Thalassobaculum fulvum TaxID=1633335 RepID=A0A918XSW9_9PROT|nr:SPOR domain-containing protein [Thalassobaculum fulvum]GHD49530.1 hypothetical protein GCM10017083_21900 [Thalassobaculum fulvum]